MHIHLFEYLFFTHLNVYRGVEFESIICTEYFLPPPCHRAVPWEDRTPSLSGGRLSPMTWLWSMNVVRAEVTSASCEKKMSHFEALPDSFPSSFGSSLVWQGLLPQAGLMNAATGSRAVGLLSSLCKIPNRTVVGE